MEKRGKSFLFLAVIFGFVMFEIALISADIFIETVTINSGSVAGQVLDFLGLGLSLKEIILGIIVIAIIFAGLYDILELTAVIQNQKVRLVIAGGLALAFALLGLIGKVTIFFLSLLASLGAIGIFLEILIAIVVFIGLSFGSTWFAKWAAKRKGQAAEIRAIESAGDAKAAIRGLREINREFKRK